MNFEPSLSFKKIIEVSTIFITSAKYYNSRALYFFLAKLFSNGKECFLYAGIFSNRKKKNSLTRKI